MPISRREFLGSAALGIVLPRFEVLLPLGSVAGSSCPVVDLGADCTLRESFDGYRARMPAAAPRVPVLIVPAALSIPRAEIEQCLRNGGTVIFETGIAFADGSRYAWHADAMMRTLGIRIEPPIDLWPRRTPYVDFTWPASMKVRDFSRLVPLAAWTGEAIARADGVVAALRRSMMGGTLVVLGTPLGPALLAGDAEAERWLGALW